MGYGGVGSGLWPGSTSLHGTLGHTSSVSVNYSASLSAFIIVFWGHTSSPSNSQVAQYCCCLFAKYHGSSGASQEQANTELITC